MTTRLTATTVGDSAATSGAGAGGDPRPANGPPRLLLVDDCAMNRRLVESVLCRWHIVPTVACNGQQAVQFVQDKQFDLVLMDILMPVMDGVAATRAIRRWEQADPTRRRLPIVAYTTLDLDDDLAPWLQVGLTGFLPKPCSATSLRSCLERWCPGHLGGTWVAGQGDPGVAPRLPATRQKGRAT